MVKKNVIAFRKKAKFLKCMIKTHTALGDMIYGGDDYVLFHYFTCVKVDVYSNVTCFSIKQTKCSVTMLAHALQISPGHTSVFMMKSL